VAVADIEHHRPPLAHPIPRRAIPVLLADPHAGSLQGLGMTDAQQPGEALARAALADLADLPIPGGEAAEIRLPHGPEEGTTSLADRTRRGVVDITGRGGLPAQADGLVARQEAQALQGGRTPDTTIEVAGMGAEQQPLTPAYAVGAGSTGRAAARLPIRHGLPAGRRDAARHERLAGRRADRTLVALRRYQPG